jgi:hypothetical protein
MKLSKLNKLYLLPVALLLAPLASASALFGQFGFDGPGVLVFNSAGADYIEFCQTTSGLACSNSTSATGDIYVTGPGTNSFSGLAMFQAGTIDNTTDSTPPVAPYTYLPVGAPASVSDYITLSGENWNFTATMLPLAVCPTPSSTQVCVGAFELNANGPNVDVTANVYGTLTNVASGGTSDFDLILSGQYDSTNIGAVISGALSTTGVFSDSWSGTLIATAVPEPGTLGMLLTGVGLISISLIARRRRSS